MLNYYVTFDSKYNNIFPVFLTKFDGLHCQLGGILIKHRHFTLNETIISYRAFRVQPFMQKVHSNRMLIYVTPERDRVFKVDLKFIIQFDWENCRASIHLVLN